MVFHELWISEAVLSAHRHKLTRGEGKGQQSTSNRGGTESRVGGGKDRHLENFEFNVYYAILKLRKKRENLTLTI